MGGSGDIGYLSKPGKIILQQISISKEKPNSSFSIFSMEISWTPLYVEQHRQMKYLLKRFWKDQIELQVILDGIVFKEIVAKTQKECTYLQRMLMSAKVFELLNFDFNIFEKWMGSATFKPNITAIAYAILTLGKRVQFCKPNLVKFFSFFLNEVYSILLLEDQSIKEVSITNETLRYILTLLKPSDKKPSR